jgi:hypothetical protein
MQPEPRREVQYDGVHCTLSIQKPSPHVVVLRISGTDVGEFGDAPMLELNRHLDFANPVHLFIDARDVRGASIAVSGEWAKWLRSQKERLREISMLTGSRFIEVTADFVRRFANLQTVMRIYTEPEAFDAALAESLHYPLNRGNSR